MDTGHPPRPQPHTRTGTRRSPRILSAMLLTAMAMALLLPAAASARRGGQDVHAWLLTSDGELLNVQVDRNGTVRSRVNISGLRAGESLVGIDIRPANGDLVAIGSSSQVYTVNVSTGRATRVGAQFTPALSGSNFGVDFNPTVDRIRVVSDTGQNLRINPDTGAALVDGTLAYLSGDRNAGRTPRVAAAAYTNSVAGATTTTLYDLDYGTDTLVKQTPANDGTLSTTGSLGINFTGEVAFDIVVRPTGAGTSNLGVIAASSTLYGIDLATGGLTLITTVDNEVIVGMALVVS